VSATLPRQGCLDDLGTPLSEVTFAVVDLETTGAVAGRDRIIEVGAARFRGGECLGTFQTLVNPGGPIPPFIVVLTGITQALVLPAPPVEEVLPTLLEFLGDAVLVGHNLRFDTSFLDADLLATGRSRLPHQRVDTLALARRLVRDEVPNLRLGTLARCLRLPHQPTHRALDDVLATAGLLHVLLERAGTFGILGLDDLLALPSTPMAMAKLPLARRLPRQPGVYLFKDGGGRVLYVGKATDLRARVRSYFSSDDRRKIPQLLRETAAIDHVVCAHPLEAAVLELRLIQAHEPRFNRRAKAWRSYAYLKLTLSERFPRLAVVRQARDDGNIYVGPLHSASAVRALQEAIESALPLRRCPRRLGQRMEGFPVASPCVPAQLGVACCPCSGHTGEAEYDQVVDRAVRGLSTEPDLLLEPLAARMGDMASAQRFEEAALTRDRLAALTRALRRQRLLDRMTGAGRVVVEAPEGRVELDGGRLLGVAGPGPAPEPGPVGRAAVDEVLVVGRWLEDRARAGRLRLLHAEGELASPLPALPTYEPRAQ
jgi:DNA polymerase III subunit epsilon